ncbi:MAG: PAS domain-containing protein, partial [bacterium]|nr:PAS domain-containing protein [bacterium]
MVQSTMHDEVLTHLRSGVLLVNRKGELMYMNPAAERFLSVSLSVARGKKLSEIIDPNEGILQLIEEVLESGRTIRAHDLEIQLQSGPHLYHVEIAPIGILENPSGALLWISEMTMAQALQEESRLRDRLDMMGTIASGL